jgi:hypothetical protein
MSWHLSGTYYAPCSCKVGCPCALGELEADQGWCSGAILLDIRSGNVDGVDVSGTKAFLLADWPSGFLSGNGTGRLYFDPGVAREQRSALEAVLKGQRGGVFEVFSALIPTFLPTKEAPITLQAGADETRATIGEVAEVVVTPLRGASGEYTRLLHGAAAFRDDLILGRGTGTRGHDPEMRTWQSGGHGEQGDFDWSA